MNTPYDFYRGTPNFCIPAILASKHVIRKPEDLPPPQPRGVVQLPPCWQRCMPTYHAFAWVYRAPLMAKLVQGFDKREPALDPLDIWVWELMAAEGVLDKAICVSKPLVDRRRLHSIKDQQDDPQFLSRVYSERGHGK